MTVTDSVRVPLDGNLDDDEDMMGRAQKEQHWGGAHKKLEQDQSQLGRIGDMLGWGYGERSMKKMDCRSPIF